MALAGLGLFLFLKACKIFTSSLFLSLIPKSQLIYFFSCGKEQLL